MNEYHRKFLKDSERVAFDTHHRDIIRYNMSKYEAAVENGKLQFFDLELARKRAAYIKRKTIGNLDKYLEEFETNFIKNGGKVIWAVDNNEATTEIIKIVKARSTKTVVKSKSMTTEEIGINKLLEETGAEVIETDLGEYIVQLAGERPYHIVTPAMHKSCKEIAGLFNKKFGTPPDSSATYLSNYVRDLLRTKFTSAGIGITGANFLLADIGGVAVTENEGNALMSTSFPSVHIVLAGIEKIIPSMEDLNILWSLLSSFGTGQKITAYNTIFTGPRKDGEFDGPDQMFVILLDNNRTKLLSQNNLYEALCCIRCGSCLNACPVYRNIGGYTYDSVYGGPIGSIITPYLYGLEKYKHLSFASSLCGKFNEECPVKIDIQRLLLLNRQTFIENGMTEKKEIRVINYWKKAMLNRRFLNLFGRPLKNAGMKLFVKKAWGKRRKLPRFQESSFNRQWKAYIKKIVY
ncbi:MAG: lactate utilization protein [Bacteroidia bacterium]|nr:lactate utilization protein [Bacteroidia bacterium]